MNSVLAAPIDKRILVFLLLVIALVAMPHLGNLPLPIMGFFYLILGWRGFTVYQSRWSPDKRMILFLTLSGLGLLALVNRGILGLHAGTSVLIVALALKLMEIKAARDIYLLVYLTLFMTATQFFYNRSLLMGFYLVLSVCLLMAVLVAMTAHNSQRPLKIYIKTAATLFIQAIPIMLLLFVLFPRLSGPLFHFTDPRDHAKTGLSHELKPGSINNLSTSREMVLRITFEGEPVPPSERYWRGPVFWHTDGKRWTQSNEHPIASHRRLNATFTGTPYRYTLMQEPQHSQWVFALDFPAAYPPELQRTDEFQLFSKRRENKVKSYLLTSYSEYTLATELTPHEQRLGLQLPGEPTPRIRDLVAGWQQNNADDAEIVAQGVNFLGKARFTYTLIPPKLGDHPVDEFLFETRQGYCEHYATSFVYLMRVAGIPARVVTGYMGGMFNQVGDFLEVRQANAHAWAEVWLVDKGWTRVDPTYVQVPERIEQEADLGRQVDQQSDTFMLAAASESSAVSAWWQQLEFAWSAADHVWNTWVIRYNSDRQFKFLAQFGMVDLRTMIIGLLISVALFALALLIFLLRRRPAKVDKAMALYDKFCRKLGRKGLIRQPSEAANDFARRAALAQPTLASSINEITQAYVHIRYARNPQQNDVKTLASLVQRFDR